MDRSAPSPGEQALSCTKGLQSERFNLPRICHPDAIVRKPLRKLHAERTIYSRPKSQDQLCLPPAAPPPSALWPMAAPPDLLCCPATLPVVSSDLLQGQRQRKPARSAPTPLPYGTEVGEDLESPRDPGQGFLGRRGRLARGRHVPTLQNRCAWDRKRPAGGSLGPRLPQPSGKGGASSLRTPRASRSLPARRHRVSCAPPRAVLLRPQLLLDTLTCRHTRRV